MKEDGKNGQRRYETNEEKIDAEEPLRHSAPVRELVFDELLWYKPSNENACQETANRKEDLTSDKVKNVE